MKNNISYENLLQLAAKEVFESKMSEMPSDKELNKLYGARSTKHKKKMQKLIRVENRKNMIYSFIHRFSKVYLIFTLSFIMLSTTLLSAKAVSESVVITLIDWKDKFTNIFVESEYIESELPHIVPTYIPEGFTLVSDFNLSNDSRIFDFENSSSGYISIYLTTYSQNFTANVDNEHSEYYMLNIDSVPGTWIQQEDKNILIISAKGIFYNITGTIPLDEIVEIYKNLK